MTQLNSALIQLAERQVWIDAGGKPMEKVAVVPPGGGAPPMDPAMAGGAPPMDPAMAGGAPPMDPAMAGGAPPMDPMAAAAGGMPMDPAAAGGAPAAGGKMKPEQMMQMLDFRLYNMQQQLTAIMNGMGIELPPGALVTPPGSPTPVAEAAVPGGPQDPSQDPTAGGGGGGGSAIGTIEAIQGASPELAMGGMGGGEKVGADLSFSQLLEKIGEGKADVSSTDGDVDSTEPSSSTPQKLPAAHPGKRPPTQAITAGGSVDPKSQVDGEKHAASNFGQALARQPENIGFADVLANNSPSTNVAAVAALMRRNAAPA